MKPKTIVSVVAALAIVSWPSAAQDAGRIDDAFEKFLAADSPSEAEDRIDDIMDSDVDFTDAYQRLRQGRKYEGNDAGIVRRSYRGDDGVEYYYDLDIPESYDPSRQYQARYQLHGGVGGRTSNQPTGNGEVRIPGAEQIYITPYSWNAAPWWGDAQVENLRAILDKVKREYNVNENRVVVSGVSDGGTGAYFIGMRETTRFASLLPLNAFIMVLTNTSIDDGRSFPENLRNKPLFVINGGRDRLYPTENVGPSVEYLAARGVETSYYPQPEGEHNTRWWTDMRDTFEQFVTVNAREPHPDWITWEAAEGRHNRAHWVVIEDLDGTQNSPVPMPDMNIVGNLGEINRFIPAGRPMFRRLGASGRLDVERNGNTIRATTNGVGSFRLLLSPDVIDFGEPVEVIANGSVVFDGEVERDIETLLRWAARDNDRTMLYGAEREIRLD
jgi:predicted esterase